MSLFHQNKYTKIDQIDVITTKYSEKPINFLFSVEFFFSILFDCRLEWQSCVSCQKSQISVQTNSIVNNSIMANYA